MNPVLMAGGDAIARRTGASDGHVVTKGVDTSHGAILYLESVSVSFDGFKALNDLTLTVDAGELRCVIGPNGAGKTTMMDVITGKTRPDAGTAFFGQSIDLTRLSEPEIADTGIGRKFQKPTIFTDHTVFENLELARKADKRVWPTLRAKLDSVARDRIATILETIKLAPEADRLVEQEQLRLLHQQHPNLEPLLLAVREEAREPVRLRRQVDGR